MSALGQKQTCAAQKGMSALPLKADTSAAYWSGASFPLRLIKVERQLIVIRRHLVMNVGVASPAECLEVRRQFIEDANIGEVMNLRRRTLLAAFTDSLRTAESCNAAFAPERAAEIPLISRLSIEGFDFLTCIAPLQTISREQLCNLVAR